MVGSFVIAGKRRNMSVSKWALTSLLSLFLLLQTSAAFYFERPGEVKRLYGDVNDDEVAIDGLEDFLETRGGGGGGGAVGGGGGGGHHGIPNLHPTSNSIVPPPPPAFHPGPPPPDYLQPSPPDLRTILKIGEKIPFAVPPRDPRYYLPSEVLREEELAPAHPYPSEGMIRKSSGPEPSAGGVAPPPHDSPLLTKLYIHLGHLLATESGSEARHNNFYPGHDFGPERVSGEGSKSRDQNSVNFLQHSPHQAEMPEYHVRSAADSNLLSDFYFVALVSGCTAAAVCGVVAAGICYFRLHKSKRDAADAEYPAYGVTGPCKDFSPAAADRKLAQSAHMFHYQHQKQQMIALEKSTGDDRRCSASDVDSEEDGEEGDYTVYECPGLAPTGEMEVKNPLFNDDPTPATPAQQQQKTTTDSRKDDNELDDDD